MKTIPLTQGKVALVDDELFDELNKYKWFALRDRKTFYARRNIRLPSGEWTSCDMHLEVFRLLGEEVLETVDHKDRDGLNNQRHNLRQATRAQQNLNRGKRTTNTSGYIGVSWHKIGQKWQAEAEVGGKRKYLGLFDDPAEAARIRDEYVHKHYGEFGVLNGNS